MLKEGDKVRVVETGYAAVEDGSEGVVTKVEHFVPTHDAPYDFVQVKIGQRVWLMVPQDGDRIEVIA